MLRPSKMKYIDLTVLKTDMNVVLEFLGKNGSIHFHDTEDARDNPVVSGIKNKIDRLLLAAEFLGINIEENDIVLNAEEENIEFTQEERESIAEQICSAIENLKNSRIKNEQEKNRLRETFNEAQAFARLNVPFTELDQLSYLTLRMGYLDKKGQAQLKLDLGDRAVIIPLDDDSSSEKNRVLAASSRKGRFTLDSQLKKASFEPIKIPQDFQGVPSEIMKSLKKHIEQIDEELLKINNEKESLRISKAGIIKNLVLSWRKKLAIEEIKNRFTVTESLYHFSGWTPADEAGRLAKDLVELTGGRIAIKVYSPQEVPSVIDGSQKVPVQIKHGAFVKGFQGVVFSYGAPLYGTIDPTPLVAFFFTLLFGIMFGDVGHGFVLLLIGILIKKFPKKLGGFANYSTPLVSIGLSSMFFGIVFGAVFTNEFLLVAPTRAITSAITGNPMDRFVTIMPLSETGGSLIKLMYFFGFTIAIGIILISIGLTINIVNHCILKKYETAFFSKTGLAGLFIFLYAVFIAVRLILGGSFALYDYPCLVFPVLCIFFGPVIWRIIAREKPVMEHGVMTFFMEGFVEILETISTYVSNTVSFLRVGAFALSHTVLSFIVFTFSGMLASQGIAGSITAVFILIFGNTVIIVLEGMIVAIQVVRLQYYEFFNKFFVETGVEFSPFRLNSR